jgi:Flp pilus assembly protein TadD
VKKTRFGRAVTVLLLASAMATAELPSDIGQRYAAGKEALARGRAYEALELLGSVAADAPEYRDVQILLGQACLVMNLVRQAQRHFERVLEADPSNGHAAFLLGLTLYHGARYFEAAEALVKARRLAPQNPHPLVYHGLSLLKLGRPEEARAAVDAALRQAPGEPAARLALAELELAGGRVQTAEARVREVLSAAPGSPEAVLLLARVLLQAARPEEAVALLEPLRRSAPERSEVLYLLSQSLLRSEEAEEGRLVMGQFKEQRALEEQIKVLESALAMDPDDLDSRIRLVGLLLDHGVVGSAPIHLGVLARRLPDDPRVRRLMVEMEELRQAGR